MIKNNNYSFFIKAFLLSSLFLYILSLLLGFWWLNKSGDLRVEEVIQKQEKGEFTIFGSAVKPNFAYYKLKMYEEFKPDIIAIGTSRVMQFKESFFSQKFLNMGGSFDSLVGLRECVDAMLKIHKPKALVIGLDFWWFGDGWNAKFTGEEPTHQYDIQSIVKPFEWLADGKISLKEFSLPFTGGFRENRYGIQAQIDDSGFGVDGSYYYTSLVTGESPPHDKNFQNTLNRIKNSNARFEKTDGLNLKKISDFINLYNVLIKNDIEVFVFMTPLAALIVDEMLKYKKDYKHLFELAVHLKSQGVPVHDYTDLRRLDSTDCEFIDGFHGGDISYARILADMGKTDFSLKKYLNTSQLNLYIKNFSGLAMIPDLRATSLPEIDFLNLNCPKKHQHPNK